MRSTDEIQKKILHEVKDIIKSRASINSSDKDTIYDKLDRLLFLNDSNNITQDDLDLIEEVLLAMTNLDFSRRLPFEEEEVRTPFNFMSLGLNMLSEELKNKVISRGCFESFIQIFDLPILITDDLGIIQFVNKACSRILNDPPSFINSSIHNLFSEGSGLPVSKEVQNFESKLKEANGDKQTFWITINEFVDPITNSRNYAYFLKDKPDSYISITNKGKSVSSELKEEESSYKGVGKVKGELFELAEGLMSYYTHWSLYVKEPDRSSLLKFFEVLDCFRNCGGDIQKCAEAKSISKERCRDVVKKAIQVLNNNSTKEKYNNWIESNLPLQVFTKKDLVAFKEKLRYEAACEFIKSLQSQLSVFEHARKIETLQTPVENLDLEKKVILALKKIPINILSDFSQYDVESLVKTKKLSGAQVEKIKLALSKINCLYLLKETSLS